MNMHIWARLIIPIIYIGSGISNSWDIDNWIPGGIFWGLMYLVVFHNLPPYAGIYLLVLLFGFYVWISV
jgi:hypothetical protein